MLSHISGHPSATSRVQDSESTSAEDQCPTAGPRNQQTIGNILSRKTWATWVMGRFTDGSRVTKYDPLSARGAIYCSGCGGDKRNCPAVRLDPLISRAAVWHVTARPWRHQPAGPAECARRGSSTSSCGRCRGTKYQRTSPIMASEVTGSSPSAGPCQLTVPLVRSTHL